MIEPQRCAPPRKAPNVRTYFDRESRHYEEERYRQSGCDQLAYQTRRRLTLDLLGPGSGLILDIGSGPGILTTELLSRGYRVCELDLSLEMLRTSRANVPTSAAASVSFVEGRLPELPFADCSFDAVLCIGVLAYLANPEKALMEIRRILRRDGLVVLQASNALCLTARLHSTLRRWYRRLGEALGGPAYPHLRIPLRALRPGTLHRLLEDARFRIESHALYDFRPPLLQWVAPSAALATAQRLQRLQHSHMLAWLGEGIVLRARAC